MGTPRETLHQKEEAQANRFAAGLLMPKPWFVAQTDELGTPELAHLRVLASTYSVSMEAAANRYAELTHEICAFVFIRNGRIRYARPSKTFPPLAVRSGDAAPTDCQRGGLTAGSWTRADVGAWLRLSEMSRRPDLRLQVVDQSGGFQTVLLNMDAAVHEDDAEEADLIESYTPRFGRR